VGYEPDHPLLNQNKVYATFHGKNTFEQSSFGQKLFRTKLVTLVDAPSSDLGRRMRRTYVVQFLPVPMFGCVRNEASRECEDEVERRSVLQECIQPFEASLHFPPG
jgi:hypothetical protein